MISWTQEGNLNYMENYIAQIFGRVNPPLGVDRFPGGLSEFISNILKLLLVVAGIYALFNFVLAGYEFLAAGGDPKKVADAWAKIYNSMVGLLITAGAFILAGIISLFLYRDPLQIFRIVIYGPA